MVLKSLLFSDPVLFLVVAFAPLYSIIAHEVAHGGVAKAASLPKIPCINHLTIAIIEALAGIYKRAYFDTF
jgi:hypothetical protein